MESLKEISSRLMKPAKDMVEFTFPMSQILDDYNQALKAHVGEIKFGEAALVIQNSTNIYDKRVERLFGDALAQSKSILDSEAENEAAKNSSKSNRRSRKSKIDFENFEPVDFTKEVNKNINLRPEKEQKKLTFISPRYPQLEKGLCHNFSLDILDISGEVIGKKYDYRLNGYMTSTCMLVDEITSSEFHNEPSRCRGLSEATENDNEIPQTSDSFIDEFCDNSRDGGIFSPFHESGYGTTSNTPCSRINSFTDSAIDHEERLSSPSPSMPTTNHDSTIEIRQSESGIELESPNSSEEEIQNPARHENSTCDSLKNNQTRESIETDCGYTSGDAEDLNQSAGEMTEPEQTDRSSSENSESRRSKSNTIEESEKLLQRSFSPVPVTEIPDAIPKRRAAFKMPCNIVLLKSTIQKRKRKTYAKTTEQKKSRKNFDNESESGRSRKTMVYSPSDNMYDTMKTEVEELQRLFEERYKSRLHETYEALTCENDNLLGFRPLSPKAKSISPTRGSSPNALGVELEIPEVRNNQEECLQSDDEVENRLSPAPEASCSTTNIQDSSATTEQINDRLCPPLDASCSYTPPHSPEYVDDFDLSEPDEPPQVPRMSHQEQVERRMKELRDKFDNDNGRVGETTRWLEAMNSLKNAEKRPIFHVQDYEKRVIGALKKTEDNRLDFDEVVAQEDPEDIARIFLASLHLANTYNVGIGVSSGKSVSKIDLRLLKSNSSHAS